MNDGTGTVVDPDPDPAPAPQGFLWPQVNPLQQWKTAAYAGSTPQWTTAIQTASTPLWTLAATSSQQYVYDALNRLTSLTNPSGQSVSFTYDALSRITGTNYPNGVTTQSAFNTNSRLTALTHQNGGSPVSSFNYSYDAINQRTALNSGRSGIPTAQASLGYSYDVLNRLIQATRPLTGDPDETFNYDSVGNRLDRDGQVGSSIFDNGNAIVEDALFTYVHDANGNLTSKTNKATNEVVEYSWDAENRLTAIVERLAIGQPATKTIAYAYDALDRRILKDVDGTITSYVYDGEDILHEYNGAGVLQARFTHGASTDEPLIVDRNGASHFYQSDGLGSVTELTDSNGDVVQSYAYDAYGNLGVFNSSGQSVTLAPITNPYTYTGREFDEETGLYYYRARYYDSGTGRFLSEDPIGFSSGDVNLYRYVGNNPINFIDPDGECLVQALGRAGAAGGFAVAGPPGAAVGLVLGVGLGLAGQELLNVFSKGGDQNKRSDEFKDLSDQQVSDQAKDRSLGKEQRRKLVTEDKARKNRNKQKRIKKKKK